MDGPRGYYAKCNKSVKEGQIPHDFTYMWNIKNNKQTNLKQIHRYREQTDGGHRGGSLGDWVKEVKK